jgi:hypothetical protein
MFEYQIWINSGACIEGAMDSENADKLKYHFKNESNGRIEFMDSDGELIIDIFMIEAISLIPKKNEPQTIGIK